MSTDLLMDLDTPAKDVQDTRVPTAMAEYLGVTILILTINPVSSNVRESTYHPRDRDTGGTVLIGHIEDKHFVPIQRGKT